MSAMKFYRVENIAMFLQEQTGSVLSTWRGKLSAKQQRAMFGQYLGKGTLIIDGSKETIVHRVKVCFGLDFEDTHNISFNAL